MKPEKQTDAAGDQQFKPDDFGYAPTSAPLIYVMGSREPSVKGGLIVYARHGGKLGLTHMDKLINSVNEHALLCEVAEAAAHDCGSNCNCQSKLCLCCCLNRLDAFRKQTP